MKRKTDWSAFWSQAGHDGDSHEVKDHTMKWIKLLLAIARVVLKNPRTREELADIAATIFGTILSMPAAPRGISYPADVRALVVKLNLLRSARFDRLTDFEWRAIWNGYGPDSWPAWLRSTMTWIYRYQEAVAGPHDEWFDQSDGTRETWRVVMDQWTANAHTVLAYKFPMWKAWLWAQRAIEWGKMEAAIAVLEVGSYDAWVDAAERRAKGGMDV